MKNIYEDLFFCFNFLFRAKTYYYPIFMTINVKQKLLVESVSSHMYSSNHTPSAIWADVLSQLDYETSNSRLASGHIITDAKRIIPY
jgi:hypothetical protein